jgi:transcription initiation factor TFIIF subunit beta
MDMLFSAFEEHQYYNIKDLVEVAKQPAVSVTHTHIQKPVRSPA